MKNFLLSIRDRLCNWSTRLANEAAAAADLLIANVHTFEAVSGERVMLSPYGDFPHTKGMQRFTRKEAESIVANFNLERTAAGDAFGGLPFYIGHPDVDQRFTDTRAVGWIKKLAADDKGLYANVDWNELGKELTEKKIYKFLSPVWSAPRNGSFLMPERLRSAGLTNMPNLPVPPLANESTPNPKEEPKMKFPLSTLTLLGLAADATEEQVNAKIAEITGAATANTASLTEVKGKLTTVETDLSNERTAHTASKDLLTKAQEARADIVLGNAVQAGRITPAEKDGWRKDLLANEAKFGELEALKPKIKTEARTVGIKSRQAAKPSDAVANVQAAVGARIKETGESYDTAFANIKSTKPELFANMQQPEKAHA